MRFGVVGDPVMHSRSPAIHSAGFLDLGVGATFEHLPTPADSFGEIVARLRNGDLNGVSVTMPHKDNAFATVDILSDVARQSKAVNTIVVREDGQLYGTNTDVAGVIHALETMSVGSAGSDARSRRWRSGEGSRCRWFRPSAVRLGKTDRGSRSRTEPNLGERNGRSLGSGCGRRSSRERHAPWDERRIAANRFACCWLRPPRHDL